MIRAKNIPESVSRSDFESRTQIRDNGCLAWIGNVNAQGYGRMTVEGGKFHAHRIALYLAGIELPAGMVVDHLCRNRRCVNVDHLEVTTQQVNTARGVGPAAARAAARLQGRCVNGHVIAEVGTYTQGKRGAPTCAECSRERVRRYKARKIGLVA